MYASAQAIDFLAGRSEHELERVPIARIEHFLCEMGGLFAFVRGQYRLEIG